MLQIDSNTMAMPKHQPRERPLNLQCRMAGFMLLCILLMGTWQRIVFCQTSVNHSIQQEIINGIEQIIRNDFTGARKTYQHLTINYPEHPAGYFYLGVAYQTEMLDQEDYAPIGLFESTLHRCIALSRKQRTLHGEDVWMYFYEGSAYLYLSFMDGKRNKYLNAFRNAGKGVGFLEKAIKMDSTFYDAYLGVGSYKYWKSDKTKALKWLPFISDEREAGIEMIRTAIQKGTLVNLLARDHLVWVLLNKGELTEALQLAEQNHRDFPESRFYRWTLVEAYDDNQHREKASLLYRQLLQEVRRHPRNNHYNEIICLLNLAKIQYFKKNFIRVNRLTSELLNLKLSPNIQERAKSKLKEARKLQQQAELHHISNTAN